MIDVLTVPALAGVRHGFLGRAGGVSTGIFSSLNTGLGSSDARAQVVENRARAVAAVAPGAQLATLHQAHSANAVRITGVAEEAGRPQADGMATNVPGIVLGILTADCAPVLLADPKAGVIGAAHAGWKGALGGVLAATIAQMEMLGARRPDIRAAIGPCIAQRSYEVDDWFRVQFETADPQSERFFKSGTRAAHHQFNLEGFAALQLARADIAQVHACSTDTYADAQAYFSYRRTTHAGEADYGRQISLIALPL